ncbi:MAG: hypothetical protein ACPIDR_02915, partial [Candidatus Puniceispirillaceae bacterium]
MRFDVGDLHRITFFDFLVQNFTGSTFKWPKMIRFYSGEVCNKKKVPLRIWFFELAISSMAGISIGVKT